MKFFWDTFAFIELIKGNEKVMKYAESEGITTALNLYELIFALLRSRSVSEASFYLDKYWPMIVEWDKEAVIEAAQFKFEHKKLDLSYADALGYIVALKHNAKFLTGDAQFRGMPNVEFVK
jgi:predicted nucleic acid-binding protein